tara:strand:- start:20 stop:871 length:852 start_codon:yes stop_codon:yes gene_type:complete
MKNNLSIIIAHYYPKNSEYENPLIKTLETINNDYKLNKNLEVIIADDGSSYSNAIMNDYSTKIKIENDFRDIFVLKNEKLELFLKKNSINYSFIKGWVYLPKLVKCMSKARVLNYAYQFSKNDKLLFLDDDNYFISNNSVQNTLQLFNVYSFIVGQIKDNKGRLRPFSSNRVQGTTIAIKKDILNDIKGFSEWTEEFSCGIDSDLWIRVYNYFNSKNSIKACYTNQLSTYDSHSKRWGKFTKIFKDWHIRKKFRSLYQIKNYKSSNYNSSRKKELWIENLIND